MKNSTSTGSDSLSIDVMKQCPEFFLHIISHLFSLVVFKKKFPNCLKTSKIIPLKKPGKKKELMESYRPISILPTLEKILENLMRTQLEEYFEKNNLIPE